jgi:hypothetical protein
MVPVVVVVLESWALTVMMMVGGHDGMMAHDAVMDLGHGPRPATIVSFLVAWQVMTGAMMVPSSLPMVRLFAGAGRGSSPPAVGDGHLSCRLLCRLNGVCVVGVDARPRAARPGRASTPALFSPPSS